MLKRMGSIVLLAALAAVPVLRSTPALGQLTPEEAAAKLREKQAARSAMRDRIVQISQGELDDLKLKISGLEAQVRELRASQGSAAATAAPQAALIRVIAVGATSDQVKEFLRRRPNEYEVMADTTSTPKIMAKTTIRSTDVVSGSSPGVFIAGRPNNAEKQAEQTTEEGNRIETLVLSRKVYKDMPTGGKHESYNGVTSTTIIETKKMWAPVEKMTVTITDGVVSGIDRQVQG